MFVGFTPVGGLDFTGSSALGTNKLWKWRDGAMWNKLVAGCHSSGRTQFSEKGSEGRASPLPSPKYVYFRPSLSWTWRLEGVTQVLAFSLW